MTDTEGRFCFGGGSSEERCGAAGDHCGSVGCSGLLGVLRGSRLWVAHTGTVRAVGFGPAGAPCLTPGVRQNFDWVEGGPSALTSKREAQSSQGPPC